MNDKELLNVRKSLVCLTLTGLIGLTFISYNNKSNDIGTAYVYIKNENGAYSETPWTIMYKNDNALEEAINNLVENKETYSLKIVNKNSDLVIYKEQVFAKSFIDNEGNLYYIAPNDYSLNGDKAIKTTYTHSKKLVK